MSYTENEDSFMALIADKIIVHVSGNKDTPEATLCTFVAAIDFAAATKLAQ